MSRSTFGIIARAMNRNYITEAMQVNYNHNKTLLTHLLVELSMMITEALKSKRDEDTELENELYY